MNILTMIDLQKTFQEIRDIPFHIPLSYTDEDRCCSGKHKKFLEILTENVYDARWRVCTFKWSTLHLPESVLAVPHSDDTTHAYLEITINSKWKKVDATWDMPLRKIFPVNEWDGVSDTTIAVPCISLYSPEESASIMANETQEMIENDLNINWKFYEALNKWLEEIRLQ